MFGHDNNDDKKPNNNDQGVVTPNDGDNGSTNSAVSNGAPAFDTSSVKLDLPEPAAASAPAHAAPSANDDVLKPSGDDDLIGIKQEALQALSPLVGHLDQSPEEKFRTTMMMIQASDDQSLVKSAYEAAKQITDDKVRAQALLDIINEINYFTQQSNS